MINCEVINNPTEGTLKILSRRIIDRDVRERLGSERIESVALIQGRVSRIIALADEAEKTADVTAAEVTGACPQHLTVIALIGSLSAVHTVVERIEEENRNTI